MIFQRGIFVEGGEDFLREADPPPAEKKRGQINEQHWQRFATCFTTSRASRHLQCHFLPSISFRRCATVNFIQRMLGRGKEEEQILTAMEALRKLVSQALEARDKAGIKVRQPLNNIQLSAVSFQKINEELLQIMKDEVNVKEVVADQNLKEEEVRLDTTITDELREEGQVREFVRAIQNARKEAGLTPRDKVKVSYGPEIDENILSKYRDEILNATNAVKFLKGDKISVTK